MSKKQRLHLKKKKKDESICLSNVTWFPKEHWFWKVRRLRMFVMVRWRWAWSCGGIILTGEYWSTQKGRLCLTASLSTINLTWNELESKISLNPIYIFSSYRAGNTTRRNYKKNTSIATYSVIHKSLCNTRCGHNVHCLNVKHYGIWSTHWSWKGY